MHLLNRQQANTGSLSRNMSNIRFYYWQHRVPHNKQSLLRMKTYQPDDNDDNDNIQPTTNVCEKLSHCTQKHRIYTYTLVSVRTDYSCTWAYFFYYYINFFCTSQHFDALVWVCVCVYYISVHHPKTVVTFIGHNRTVNDDKESDNETL